MDSELQPVSDAGRAFVALCEQHQPDFAARAGQHDSEASFPHENFAAMVASGVMAATVPQELGGLGVVALRDHIAGLNRLARGDGSTALAANMHIGHVRTLARAWRGATTTGDTLRAATLETWLREVAAGRMILAAVGSESGSPLQRPTAEAIRDGDGWRLTGRKSFATGAPVATLLATVFRISDGAGGHRTAAAYIGRDAPGVEVPSNWDALGMRASGSHDVVFKDCFIPASRVQDLGPWGELTQRILLLASNGVIGLASAFLGIAEAARANALRQIELRGRGANAAVQHLVAEMEIDLAAARATLERAAANVDALFDAHPITAPSEIVLAAAKEGQCAKWFVSRKAIDIVDHAMTLSGGSGYMSGNPLSRFYRDVRAGPFMQPFSPLEAFEFIGKITLGIAV